MNYKSVIFLLAFILVSCGEGSGPGNALPFDKLHTGMSRDEAIKALDGSYTWADTFFTAGSKQIDNIVYQPVHFAGIKGVLVVSFESEGKLKKAIFVRDDIMQGVENMSRHPDFAATFPKHFIEHIDTSMKNDVTKVQFDAAADQVSAHYGAVQRDTNMDRIAASWKKGNEEVKARFKEGRLMIELREQFIIPTDTVTLDRP